MSKARAITKINEDLQKSEENLRAVESEQIDISKNITKSRREQLVLLKELYAMQTRMYQMEKDHAKEASARARSSKISARHAEDELNATKLMAAAAKEANRIKKTGEKVSKTINDLEEQAKNLVDENSNLQKNILRNKIAQLKNVQKVNAAEAKQLSLTEEQINANEELNKIATKYQKTLQNSTNFIDDIESKLREIPVIGNLLADLLPLDKVKDSIQKNIGNALFNVFKKGKIGATDIASGLESGMAGATKGAMAFGTTLTVATGGILLAIGAIIFAFKAFYDVAMEVDKTTTEIANNLNMSKDASYELFESMSEQEVLFENMSKYSAALHKNFGQLGSVLAKDVMPRMQKLQFNLQLSDEELENLVSTSYMLGSSFEGTANKASEFETSAINATKEFYQQQGIHITNSDLISEARESMQLISGISKKTLAIYGKSAEKLFKQVLAVRKLGLEFEQVAKISDTVLDIESSIGSEMTANVLLGKHLNLNSVRQAALYGDVESVAEEINKVLNSQNINLESFNSMMPYQKKALTQSLGLGEDEIQQMLLRNKLANKDLLAKVKAGEITGAQLAKQGKITEEEAQQLITAERRTTVQQDLQMIQDQLSQSLKANMPGIQSLIKGLADFGTRVEDVGVLRAMFGGGRSQAEKAADEAKASGTSISEKQAAEANASADTGSGTYMLANALVGPMGYMMAGIKDLFFDKQYKATTMNDGVITPSSPSGYSRVLSGPEGSIALNDNDTIVAGTNLNSGGGGSNMSRVEVLLEKLIAKVDQPVYINMGGKVIDELDNRITLRKTYTTKVDSGYGVFG
jgi:hypothetical protein